MSRLSRFRPVVLAALLLSAGAVAHAAEITVSAAASLTNAFKELGQNYQRQYPDAKVNFNFAASGQLLQQIAKGAPVDVFASADQETVHQAEQQNLVKRGERQDFVRNTLVLITPVDSRLTVRNLGDLAQAGVKRVAIGNPASVPVGRYSMPPLQRLAQWKQVQPKLINGTSVRQVLDYVARGEVDAGLVYSTDAAIMKDKVKVVYTVPLDVVIRYPIAPVAESTQQVEGRRFIRYVQSPAGQAVLQRYGFSKP